MLWLPRSEEFLDRNIQYSLENRGAPEGESCRTAASTSHPKLKIIKKTTHFVDIMM
jgi:hypothetical protein